MTPTTRKNITSGIITYILANEPVTLDQLEERAKTKDWYSFNEFDAILMLVKKDSRVSATLTKEGVIYKKKKEYVSPLVAERARVAKWLRESYPPDPYEGQESPFKCCFCAMFRADDGEIYDEDKHGHRDSCDAVKYPEEYLKQNPHKSVLNGRKRKQDPTPNTEVATPEQLLLLA